MQGSVGEGVKKCFGVWRKVRGSVGEVWGSMFGCDVGKCRGRCGKVCWDVGEVGRNVGMWKSVGGGVEKCFEV